MKINPMRADIIICAMRAYAYERFVCAERVYLGNKSVSTKNKNNSKEVILWL